LTRGQYTFTALPHGTFGVWTPAEGTIRIQVDADPTQQIKTLFYQKLVVSDVGQYGS